MKVAVYGATNIDIQAVCFSEFRSADSNPGRSYISQGGVGRNIAENCARLGLDVNLVTVMGDDELSSIVTDNCARLGIGLKHSLFLKKTATPRYICMTNQDGRLIGAVAAMEAFDKFNAAEFEKRTEPGDEAAVIVLDANLPEDVITAACKRWKSKTLFFDPVSSVKAERARSCVGDFSIVKPNLTEAFILAGLDKTEVFNDTGIAAEKAAEKAAEILHKKGVAEIFISLGPDGIYFFSESGSGMVKPLDMPVLNVSGAGDAASAGILWACSKNCSTLEKARYAAAAASLCVSNAHTVSDKMNPDVLEKLAKEAQYESFS